MPLNTKAMNTFTQAMIQVPTYTKNGAISLGTTLDPFVDGFFKAVQGTDNAHYMHLFDKCWNTNKEKALRLLLHIRDCRNGKGIKHLLVSIVGSRLYSEYTKHLLKYIPEYGYWKDLLNVAEYIMNNSSRAAMQESSEYVKIISLFATQLVSDYISYMGNNRVSLCAKYAPSEGKYYDKKMHIAEDIAIDLAKRVDSNPLFCDFDPRHYMSNYRNITSKLRKYIDISEVKFCDNDWESLDFSKMPSLCMKLHSGAFNKHCLEKWEEYLTAVKENKAKMNTKMIFPYEIVSEYITDNAFNNLEKPIEYIEILWNKLVLKHKNDMTIRKILPIIDVSGSMFVKNALPLKNAVSLGLLMAEIHNKGSLGGGFFTFSSSPYFHKIEGESLLEKIGNIINTEWGGSTDFVKTFKSMLDIMLRYNIPDSECPDAIICFSDMQFNESGNWSKTNYQMIKSLYEDNGYTMPMLWFWNLNGDTLDFPVSAEQDGTLLLSGFAPCLLDIILKGNFPNPSSLVNEVLMSPRYDPAKTVIEVSERCLKYVRYALGRE